MKNLILVLFVGLFQSVLAKEVSFKDHGSFTLDEMKKTFKIHRVDIYNYSTRTYEKYHAFSMKELLDAKFTRRKWSKFPFIKINTTTKYAPMVEVYKFQQRDPYLAFERYDGKPFTTMSGYKDVVSELGPFYLIWKENYKEGAALRRDHWTFAITEFVLENNPPKKFNPTKEVHEDISWGYKNFIKQCIACHTIDGYGSPKDGELITSGLIDKRSDKWLLKFISDPKSVKSNSRMDPFPRKIDGRTTRMKNIIKYLRFVSSQQKKNYRKSKTKSLDSIMDKANKN